MCVHACICMCLHVCVCVSMSVCVYVHVCAQIDNLCMCRSNTVVHVSSADCVACTSADSVQSHTTSTHTCRSDLYGLGSEISSLIGSNLPLAC